MEGRRREPLNGNEVWKREDNGLNVRQRIEQVYSREGFASIPHQDLHGRFRWWGLYTQRKPGIDGGRTGAARAARAEDHYFMMRVRTDGGARPARLRVLGGISTEFARDTADITDRQNIQYHWVGVEDVPRSGAGSRPSACRRPRPAATSPRVFLGSPSPASPPTRSSTRPR